MIHVGLRSFIHRLTAPKVSSGYVDNAVKMVLVVNSELKMGKGKIAAQVGHAAVSATLKAGQYNPPDLDSWLKSGQKKICVKADYDEIKQLVSKANLDGIQTVEITDAGKTQIPRGSLTVAAFGPCDEEKLESLTGHLKLL